MPELAPVTTIRFIGVVVLSAPTAATCVAVTRVKRRMKLGSGDSVMVVFGVVSGEMERSWR